MKVGSLFTGISGLDLAVTDFFGAEVVWVSEVERTLLDRYTVPNLGDVTKVDWSEVEPVDIICGGFPCQDISGAGRGEGIQRGNRSGLWFEFANAIRHLRPRYVVVENVSALLARGMGIVLGDLAEAGYDAVWTSLRASDVGAPHRRERIFLVAHPSESGAGMEERRGGGSGRKTAEAREPALLRSPHGADSAEGSSTGGRDVQNSNVNQGIDGFRERRPDSGSKGSGRLQPCEPAEKAAANADCGRCQQRQSDERGVSEPNEVDSAGAWGLYEPAIRRWERIVMRPAPEALIDGRLSPRFVEWLMGYPLGWVDGMSRTAALRALGNAVVPQQARVALEVLCGASI